MEDKYAKLSASEKAIKQTTFEGYSEEDVSKLSELFSDKNRFLAISIKTTGFSKGNKPMLVDITGYTFDEAQAERSIRQSRAPMIAAFLKFFLTPTKKSLEIKECFSMKKSLRTLIIPAVAGPMITANTTARSSVRMSCTV